MSSNVISINPTKSATSERYTEKYIETTVQMICINIHLWRREKRQLATRPGELTEFWVKGESMQLPVASYRPQEYDNQCFELISKFDLLGTNFETFKMIAERDDEQLKAIQVHERDLQLKLRLLVLETCRHMLLEDSLRRMRERKGTTLPAPVIALPAPELMQ